MSQSFESQGIGRRDTPVTCQILEDRINVYISAMDRALSMNDTSMSSQLERDIQQLVDLMEKVQSGQAVTEKDVPPPLVMTPMNDVLANPLGELSSRLSDYHKALYFAEEEISDGRLNKIQSLQKGLQTIHNLQKRAQAGFPIREDEVPPPVTIPSDNEFDNNALKTITERLEQYNSILKTCQESSGPDRRRISKVQSGIRTLEFLLTRAKANRPVWRKDIPAEFDYCSTDISEPKLSKAKICIQLKSLMTRVSKVKCERQEQQNVAKELDQKLQGFLDSLSSSASPKKIDVQSLVHQVEALEMMADASSEAKAGLPSVPSQSHPDDLALIETRIKEYNTAAVMAKREGRVNNAIRHLKIVKGLKPMKEILEKGGNVDMTLVPPPPRDDTPIAETLPPLPTDVEQPSQPVGAHAQLTDVDTKKPTAVESNKNKLARKLASYLEVDSDGLSANSSSSSSVDSSPDRKPKALALARAGGGPPLSPAHGSPVFKPPVQPASPQKVSLSNIGLVGCGNQSIANNVIAQTGASAIAPPVRMDLASNSSSPVREPHRKDFIDTKGGDAQPMYQTDTYLESKDEGRKVELEAQHAVAAADVNSSAPPMRMGLTSNGSPVRQPQRNDHYFPDTKGGDNQPMYNTDSCLDSKDEGKRIEPEAQHAPQCSTDVPITAPVTAPVTANSPIRDTASENRPTKQGSNPSRHLDSIGFLSCQDVPSFSPATGPEQSLHSSNPIHSSDSSQTTEMHLSVDKSNVKISSTGAETGSKFGTTNTDTNISNDNNLMGGDVSRSIDKTDSLTSSMDTKENGSDYSMGVQKGWQSAPGQDLMGSNYEIYNSRVNEAVSKDSLAADSVIKTIPESNSNKQSINGAQSTPSNSMSNGHELKNSLPVSYSANMSQDTSSIKTISQEISDMGTLTDSFHLNKNRNADVAAMNSDSMNSAHNRGNEKPSAPLTFHGEGATENDHIRLTEKNVGEQNVKEISSADAEEFADLMNSMSLSVNKGVETLSSFPANEEASTKHEKMSARKEPLYRTETLGNTENHLLQQSEETFAKAHSSDLETSTFHSLPSSVPESSEIGRNPSEGGSMDGFHNSPSLSAKNVHQSFNSLPTSLPGASLLQNNSLFAERNGARVPSSNVNSNSSPFTCLETLKYDLLIAKAKNSEESKKEAEKLASDMEAIKDKLRKGGRKVWEEYKNRVEYELQVLNNGVKQSGETQNWEEYKYLNSKRMLNERELSMLNQRIGEVQD